MTLHIIFAYPYIHQDLQVNYKHRICQNPDWLTGWLTDWLSVTPGPREASASKNPSPDLPFVPYYAKFWGEMGLFLIFWVFELQRGYLYQNGVEFRQKVIGAG